MTNITAKYNTNDNTSYYTRTKIGPKAKLIFDYVEILKPKILLDIGCNNGNISYPIQKNLGVEVLGIDDSPNLKLPSDYKFEQCNIINYNKVYFNDVTLFLSLYHHIYGAYNQEVADDLFYSLLLKSKKLIFDSGNMSEKGRTRNTWYKELAKNFHTEKELFDHFGLPYYKLGEWHTGGGVRSIVVFDKKDFDSSVEEIDSFRRYVGSAYQRKGLVALKDQTNIKKHDGKRPRGAVLDVQTIFYKLKLNNKEFFAKNRVECTEKKPMNTLEKTNIILVYNEIDSTQLLKFYGISEKYGFIYEWCPQFQYIKRTKLKLKDKTLRDVDIIQINGQNKYIDFYC